MAKKRKITGWKTFLFFLILSLLIGIQGRFTDLGKKPMHTDEAVLAVKTKEFVDTNFFKYDLRDYHGPFLHHATKWISTIKGWDASDLSESQLRYVPAVFGIALMLLPFLVTDILGRTGAAFASLMLSISPMLTYFSRYYIMEIPFAFLIGLFIVSTWRWSQRQNPIWLVTGGVSLGLMHATKETFVINIAAMVMAWMLVRFFGASFENHKLRFSFKSRAVSTLIIGVVAMLLIGGTVSIWCFSNGFKDWVGVVDSYKTYLSYLNRANLPEYAKPWNYYLEVLFWKRDGFLWSEAFVAVMAFLGVLASFSKDIPSHRRTWIWFIAIYTIILLGIYSAISYKTPWSILSIHVGLAFLAGVAVMEFYRILNHWLLRGVMTIILMSGVLVTLEQTSRAIDYRYAGQTRYAADSRNPYVYSHTSTNLMRLVERVMLLDNLEENDGGVSIDIIHKEHGWPLPWYFRNIKEVSYATELSDRLDADVVIMDMDLVNRAEEVVKHQHKLLIEETFTSAPASKASPPVDGFPDVGFMSADATQPIPPLPPEPLEYVQSYYALRPQVMLKLWVRKDLWKLLLQEEARRESIPLD